MQNALNNPHYKKIWEEINWKMRHPEAKSLEEALALEISPFNGCMVAIDLTNVGYAMSTNKPLKVVSYNKFEYFAIEPVYSKLFAVWDSYNERVKNNAQILGRPITLEDILILLDDKTQYQGIENGYHIFGNEIHYTSDTSTYIEEHFRLKCCTIFEEQTPETWEKIANLIN